MPDKIKSCLPVLLTACLCVAQAATYHLGEQGWEPLKDTSEGENLLTVAKIKQQLLTGSSDEIIDSLEQLRSNFPQLTEAEIDGYIEAEKIYSKGKWYKAAEQYNKFMDTWPDSILQPAAMERVYGIATAFLQGQKRTFIKILKLPAFDDGVELMNKLADRAGSAPIALRALTTLAENQERRKKLLDAYDTWSQVADRWPTGETGRNALLRMAQALHAAYGGPQYDGAVLNSAASYYEDFVARYPEAAGDLEISRILDLIREQLAYKDYVEGFYYERTGKPQAAAMYYNRVLKQWPDTKAYPMAQARLSPDAPPAVSLTLRRKAVNLTGSFLDSWFGIQRLAEYILPAAGAQDEAGTPIGDEPVMDVNTRESM
ncbi:MAG: outer membrane protein assembly factor BamD [Planctomycetaceae bacterium]|nr:outer membrane protein assembly factor BamD [Planctomycetaceae bacterium]